MTVRKTLLAALLLAGLTAHGAAQVPGLPGGGAAGAAAAAAGAGAGGDVGGAAAAAPHVPTVWEKLGISKQQKEECKRKLCKTQFGQLLNNSRAPLTMLSGGMIPQYCPVTPSAAELADPGAVGAAAKIKADEAGAKERRAAVRYLGTVDCHYWPEAQDALIDALRKDRNECVRYEAALALGSGCCCTKQTIEALNIVVACSDRDGAPKETSPRVHAASYAALNRCTACYSAPPVEPPPPPKPTPEAAPPPAPTPERGAAAKVPATLPPGLAKPINPGEAKPAPDRPTPPPPPAPPAPRPTGAKYYARIGQQPLPAIVAESKRLLREQTPPTPAPAGEQSVAGLVAFTVNTGAAPAADDEDSAPRPPNLWDALTKPAPAPTATPSLAPIPTPVLPPAPAPTSPTPTTIILPVSSQEPAPAPITSDPVYQRPTNLWDLLTKPAKPTTAAPPVSHAPPAATAEPLPVILTNAELAGSGAGYERQKLIDTITPADLVATPDLIRQLLATAKAEGDTPEVRASAIRALVRCRVKTPSVLAALEALAEDATPAVRNEAVAGLGRLRSAGQARAGGKTWLR